ncbi:hypothetical protein GOL95_10050 [Sinorhizobium medicae]|nr:hypothetical protein [Sinorhizobium medicae]
MSARAKAWWKRQLVEDETLSAVLKVLAHKADSAGVCAIEQSDIAEAIGKQDRTVRRAMAALEGLGVLTRKKRCSHGKPGRVADQITLAIETDFTLSKEAISGVKKLGATGHGCPVGRVAPTDEIQAAPYKERARSVYTQTSTSNPTTSLPCSTRVWPEHDRGKWRARLTFSGLGMDLGRFDDEEEARAFADAAMEEVRHSLANPGTPRVPTISQKLKTMGAPELGAFLFGDDGSQEQEAAA